MSEDTQTPERWLPVVGYEGYYEVSSLGRVRSLDRCLQSKLEYWKTFYGQMLRPSITKQGYAHVRLYLDSQPRDFSVHILVLEAFRGPRPAGMDGGHGPLRVSDNGIHNLAWITSKQNALDKRRDGTHPELNKTHCPRGHVLKTPNLAAWYSARGERKCLACSRAQAARTRAQNRNCSFDIQTVADEYYRKIMVGDDPIPCKERTHCPRGHILEAPNLRASGIAKGKRNCLACDGAHSGQRRAQKYGILFNFQDTADRHYRKIMADYPGYLHELSLLRSDTQANDTQLASE